MLLIPASHLGPDLLEVGLIQNGPRGAPQAKERPEEQGGAINEPVLRMLLFCERPRE